MEMDGTMVGATVTTSLAPVQPTTGGGGGVLSLAGTPEGQDTTRGTVRVKEGRDVSGTVSVPGP